MKVIYKNHTFGGASAAATKHYVLSAIKAAGLEGDYRIDAFDRYADVYKMGTNIRVLVVDARMGWIHKVKRNRYSWTPSFIIPPSKAYAKEFYHVG